MAVCRHPAKFVKFRARWAGKKCQKKMTKNDKKRQKK